MKIVYLIFLLLITGSEAIAQSADFTYTTTAGTFCAPQSVTFTQTSSGNPVSYLWDFGNGQAANTASAFIEYALPGSYTVTLTVVYALTTSTISKNITINPTPTLGIAADRMALCQPGNISFTANATGGANQFQWDFGDGTPVVTTASNQATHNFQAYGSFIVSVKAITPFGCSRTAGITVTVQKLNISGTATPKHGCIPANVNFSVQTNFPPGDGLQNIAWNFDDGSPLFNGSSFTSNHNYNITTPVNATAVVTSNEGCTNSFSFPVMAYGNPPADITAHTVEPRDSFCGSESIKFYAKSNNANEYHWDFGDGNSVLSNDTVITYKYYSLGQKRVIVRSGQNGCQGVSDTINIFIKGVIALFDLSNTCSNKNTFQFHNNSLGNISAFQWQFSDNPSQLDITNFNATHTFPQVGSFTSTLYLQDYTTGCRDSATLDIYTARPTTSTSISMVCKDSLISYQVNSTYPEIPQYTYQYHLTGQIFDEGTSSVYLHHPANYGIFTDSVIITDNYPGTCSDTLVFAPVKVRGPVVDFQYTDNECMDTAIQIKNLSHPFFQSDPISVWKWEFGDNTRDSIQNVTSHLYRAPGDLTISLTAIDVNGCSQTKAYPIHIRPIPIVNILPPLDTLCSGQSTQLIAYSIDSVSWSPTTNITCAGCDTVIVNPRATTYYVAQTINSYGCRSVDTSLVKVYSPFRVQVTPSQSKICPGNSVDLSVNMPGVITWSPGQYLNNTSIATPVSTPATSVQYWATVVDSAGCFRDSARADIIVHPKPTVNAGPDQVLPYNNTFVINPVYSTPVKQYLWTPAGDLNCTDCAAPSGIALKTQTYMIAITDINGCKSSDQIKIIVQCERSNLLLPNAFTPNRDGRNDYFYPITRGYRAIRKFAIYDRTGFKVFERQSFAPNQPSMGWDGNVKGGTGANTQVFTWFVEGECDTGEAIFTKGTVILIR